jgi:hypothetical protein
MGWIVRLIEKITGTPHRHDNAAMVSLASEKLTQRIDDLSATLRPYSEADDPLVAMMTDVFNRRQLKAGRDDKPELHS